MTFALTLLVTLVASSIASVAAQDPAQGWTAYAEGRHPNPRPGQYITHASAKWIVGSLPKRAGCFYSPWFGIDSSANMNLLQPVNPTDGVSWQAYVEYFQWSPVYNDDGPSFTVKPGDTLHGSIDLLPGGASYRVRQESVATGQASEFTIPVQAGRNYTIVYFVQEKVCDCDQYSPDGEVSFFDINVEFNHQRVVPRYKLSYVEDVCNARAFVRNNETIQITWQTS